jgi:hypothetical protein
MTVRVYNIMKNGQVFNTILIGNDIAVNIEDFPEADSIEEIIDEEYVTEYSEPVAAVEAAMVASYENIISFFVSAIDKAEFLGSTSPIVQHVILDFKEEPKTKQYTIECFTELNSRGLYPETALNNLNSFFNIENFIKSRDENIIEAKQDLENPEFYLVKKTSTRKKSVPV